MLAYLKIYPDLVRRMRKLTEEQQIRLYNAMWDYGFEGIVPSFDGIEDFAWSWLQDMIDAAERELVRKATAGAKGGQAERKQTEAEASRPEADESRTKQSEAEHKQSEAEGKQNEAGLKQTEADPKQDEAEGKQKEAKKEQEQEQEHTQEQEHEKGVRGEDIARDAPGKVSPVQRRFDLFWDAYPRKTGKGAALTSFTRLKVSEDLLQVMLAKIAALKRTDQWQRDGGQYIPYPATWLNQRRWEDEVPSSSPPISRPGVDYEQRPNTENTGEDIPEWIRELQRERGIVP